MKRSTKVAFASTGVLAVVFATAGSAFAATTPPWQPGGGGTGSQVTDPANIGTVGFFDASGNQITSGDATQPFPYIQAITGAFAASGGASASFVTPNSGVAPAGWSASAVNAGNNFPIASAPAPMNAGKPTVAGTAADDTLDSYAQFEFPNADTNAAYQNIYEIRVFSSTTPNKYASADVLYNPTAHTWTQVFPNVVSKANVSVNLTATKSGTQVTGTSTVLTATDTASDSSKPAGSVQFLDGSTPVGSPVAVAAGANTASSPSITPAAGSHSYTAVFTPTDTTNYNASPASNAVLFTAQDPVATTTTNVTVTPGTGNAFSTQTLSATVTAASGTNLPAGSVQFSDSVAGILGSAPVTGTTATGTATLSTNALGSGSHVITATFQPSSGAFITSHADSASFSLTAVGATPDPQTIKVVVTPGSLTISTPYTDANPFDLGTMHLNDAGDQLATDPAPFGTNALPTGTTPYAGVTITDTRAGNSDWSASAASTVFSSGSNTITQNGLSFTGVTPLFKSGNALQSGDVVPSDITSFTAAPQSFAHSVGGGDGSVYVFGNMKLVAPTSTQAGTYKAVVTFTLA